MIQFNLLPDIKLEYIKAKRTKRSIMVISLIVGGSALTLFILLFITVNGFQKKHITDLTNDIDDQLAQLESIEDLDKILTVQNQLNSLTPLHEGKPVTTRLFKFLPQLVPQKASVASLGLNYEASTMEISGSADSISTVNKFVDTLKFTEFTLDGQKKQAFNSVVLEDFSKAEDETSYNISLIFDPIIFDYNSKIELKVPNIISTRSETQKPSEDLFKELLTTPEAQ